MTADREQTPALNESWPQIPRGLDPRRVGRDPGMSYDPILYPRLRELLDDPDTQLVEVLPPAEFVELHLPGAINIPLKTLGEQTTAALDRAKAVVVYCWDGL